MGTSAYTTARGFGVFSQSAQYDPWRNSALVAILNIYDVAYKNNLKPKIQQSLEFGLDLIFLDERINLDATYYKANTYNQILQVGAVRESGARSQLINAGNIQNQNVELELDVTPVRAAD